MFLKTMTNISNDRKLLDKIILKSKISGWLFAFSFFLFILYYLLLIILSITKMIPQYPDWRVILPIISFIIPFIIAIFLDTLDEEKTIPLVLKCISEDIKNGSKIQQKYLLFLFEHCKYKDENYFSKKRNSFSYLFKNIHLMKKEMAHLALKLNYVNDSGEIKKEHAHFFERLYSDVINQKSDKEIIGILNNISELYKNEKNFPSLFDFMKKYFENKWITFAVLEGVILLILLMIFLIDSSYFLTHKETLYAVFIPSWAALTAGLFVFIKK
jgi:hypothetical protein